MKNINIFWSHFYTFYHWYFPLKISCTFSLWKKKVKYESIIGKKISLNSMSLFLDKLKESCLWNEKNRTPVEPRSTGQEAEMAVPYPTLSVNCHTGHPENEAWVGTTKETWFLHIANSSWLFKRYVDFGSFQNFSTSNEARI